MDDIDDLGLIHFILPKKAAAMLGVTENKVAEWRFVDSGPPYYKLGASSKSLVRYRETDVLTWIEKIRSMAKTAAERGEFVPLKMPRFLFDSRESGRRHALREQVSILVPELGKIPISWPLTDEIIEANAPRVRVSKKLTPEERAQRRAKMAELDALVRRDLGWD